MAVSFREGSIFLFFDKGPHKTSTFLGGDPLEKLGNLELQPCQICLVESTEPFQPLRSGGVGMVEWSGCSLVGWTLWNLWVDVKDQWLTAVWM